LFFGRAHRRCRPTIRRRTKTHHTHDRNTTPPQFGPHGGLFCDVAAPPRERSSSFVRLADQTHHAPIPARRSRTSVRSRRWSSPTRGSRRAPCAPANPVTTGTVWVAKRGAHHREIRSVPHRPCGRPETMKRGRQAVVFTCVGEVRRRRSWSQDAKAVCSQSTDPSGYPAYRRRGHRIEGRDG